MFAPAAVERQREIRLWVMAAMRAATMAQAAALSGEISSEYFQEVVVRIANNAVKEINGIPSIPVSPSIN